MRVGGLKLLSHYFIFEYTPPYKNGQYLSKYHSMKFEPNKPTSPVGDNHFGQGGKLYIYTQAEIPTYYLPLCIRF